MTSMSAWPACFRSKWYIIAWYHQLNAHVASPCIETPQPEVEKEKKKKIKKI